jgi:phospholipase C
MAAGGAWYGRGLADALALPRRCGARLSDIEHVVFLIQENRSFDHYFGAYRGVRGFADPRAPKLADGSGLPVFAQPGYPAAGFGGHLYPFRLDAGRGGSCVHDITHEWGPQHRSWNGGRMDGFVLEHTAQEGVANGAVTMGHYTRGDLPYYYALADAFTLCDGYHCSVIGPSDPNHAYIVSGTIDPDGRHGGPLIANRPSFGAPPLSWTTMPEQLRARGVTWKVYAADTGNAPAITDTPFPMFKQYSSDSELHARGIAPVFPSDFQRDVNAGALPQVTWIYANIQQSAHPPFPVGWDEFTTDHVLRTLSADPALWAETVVFVTWDENGGFFDHAAPLTPPPGTPGEHISGQLPGAAEGISGPVGLGFRVPLLIVSPFTRGGLVCPDRFDHSSLLRFLERRFGAEVPNLSAWRRSVTGDLTSAFNFSARPDGSVPALPATSMSLPGNCTTALVEKITGAPVATPYPVPANQMPAQEPGRPRRPSGCATPRLVPPLETGRKQLTKRA